MSLDSCSVLAFTDLGFRGHGLEGLGCWGMCRGSCNWVAVSTVGIQATYDPIGVAYDDSTGSCRCMPADLDVCLHS